MVEERTVLNDYRDFIEMLNKNKVDYLIVGVYAVIKYTNIARRSKDIDFWTKNNKRNAIRCSKAIKEFICGTIKPNDLLNKEFIYYLGRPTNRIDIFG